MFFDGRRLLGAAISFTGFLPVLNASPIINGRESFSAADTIVVDSKVYLLSIGLSGPTWELDFVLCS